jgi:acetyl esterase/lipase
MLNLYNRHWVARIYGAGLTLAELDSDEGELRKRLTANLVAEIMSVPLFMGLFVSPLALAYFPAGNCPALCAAAAACGSFSVAFASHNMARPWRSNGLVAAGHWPSVWVVDVNGLVVQPLYMWVFITNVFGVLATDLGVAICVVHTLCLVVHARQLAQDADRPHAATWHLMVAFDMALGLGAGWLGMRALIAKRGVRQSLRAAALATRDPNPKLRCNRRSPSRSPPGRRRQALPPVGSGPVRMTVARDVVYSCSMQLLDIYYYHSDAAPVSGGRRRPVAVWIHGGGWVSGDKRGAESYPLLQTLYRKNGWVIVALNFRYAGSGPEGACYGPIEDLGAALRWIQQEGSAYGADPENVTLVGHSSGAHLASLYLAQEQRQHAGQRSYQRVLSIRACVFISGIYDLEQWLAEPSKGGTHPMGTYFHDLAMCVLMPRHWLVTPTSSRRRTSIMVAQADGGTSPDGALLEAVSPCGCLAHAWNMHSGGDKTRPRPFVEPLLLQTVNFLMKQSVCKCEQYKNV